MLRCIQFQLFDVIALTAVLWVNVKFSVDASCMHMDITLVTRFSERGGDRHHSTKNVNKTS